jgi:hypothetical protein
MGSNLSVLLAVGEAEATADCEVVAGTAVVFWPYTHPHNVAHSIT